MTTTPPNVTTTPPNVTTTPPNVTTTPPNVTTTPPNVINNQSDDNIIRGSLKEVYINFENAHTDIDWKKKWIYKFTLLNQLSFYFIPMIIIFIIIGVWKRLRRSKYTAYTFIFYILANIIIITGLHVYCNYITPPELQMDYI